MTLGLVPANFVDFVSLSRYQVYTSSHCPSFSSPWATEGWIWLLMKVGMRPKSERTDATFLGGYCHISNIDEDLSIYVEIHRDRFLLTRRFMQRN